MPMIRIEDGPLAVRDWRPDDLDAMHRWLGDPEVTRFLTWGARDRGDSARHLAECVAQQTRPDRRKYFLAIELDGVVIGDSGFEWKLHDAQSREGEIGYFLEPAYWGRGLATRAARLVLSLAFDGLDATVMRAACDARNARSEKVMQRLGMSHDPEQETLGRRVYRMPRADWYRSSGVRPAVAPS
jgi:RimJ/RimL family protein N-acetyltransferase